VTLRIGQIAYANCTPIFAALKANFDCRNYQFVGGVPVELNAMLGRGEIDVCPSSSIEYGKNPDKYYLLPDISISAVGPVKSVLLFSRMPMEELNNRTIGLTTESETSVNLLRILLARNFGFANVFERTPLSLQEALKSFSALLLIGDAALREGMRNSGFFVYDLGELWHKFTGLPFVFALWMVTREALEHKPDEVKSLCAELIAAKRLAYDSYGTIADASTEREWISRDALVDYWRTISYDLTPQHVEGAKTFFRFAKELGLLDEEPAIRMVGGECGKIIG
jgi:chorismate dehydratase